MDRTHVQEQNIKCKLVSHLKLVLLVIFTNMSEVAHGSVLCMFLPTIFTEAKPNFQMEEITLGSDLSLYRVWGNGLPSETLGAESDKYSRCELNINLQRHYAVFSPIAATRLPTPN